MGSDKVQARKKAQLDLEASLGLGPGTVSRSCTANKVGGYGPGDATGPSPFQDSVGPGPGRWIGSCSLKDSAGIGTRVSDGSSSIKDVNGPGLGNKAFQGLIFRDVSDGVQSEVPFETSVQYQVASGYYSDLEILGTKKMVRRAASVPLSQKKLKSPCFKVLKRVSPKLKENFYPGRIVKWTDFSEQEFSK